MSIRQQGKIGDRPSTRAMDAVSLRLGIVSFLTEYFFATTLAILRPINENQLRQGC